MRSNYLRVTVLIVKRRTFRPKGCGYTARKTANTLSLACLLPYFGLWATFVSDYVVILSLLRILGVLFKYKTCQAVQNRSKRYVSLTRLSMIPGLSVRFNWWR